MKFESPKMASQASQLRCCEACEGPESKELQIVRGDLRRLRSDFSKIGLRNSLFSGPSQGRRLRTPIGGSGFCEPPRPRGSGFEALRQKGRKASKIHNWL